MIVGTVREIKRHEYRVGLTPDCVRAYVRNGHRVVVEQGAGAGTGYDDNAYVAAGAEILPTCDAVYAEAEMIVKVKEPQPAEYALLRKDQILYTYLHLAALPELAGLLIEKQVKAIAYETIELENGHLPCLRPMSEIAGRLSVQEGAKYLEKPYGGRGVLLGGVPGVRRGKIVIIGGGIVGSNACKIAVGIGADVTILDISAERLAYLDDIFGTRITTLYSTEANIMSAVAEADVVIGAVLITGASAPRLITRSHLKIMKPGAVIVDVAVDQGGCVETTRATTHDDPVYTEEGIVHYCVANMPGVVALSSTLALTSTTLSYGLKIAGQGVESACASDMALSRGVNTYAGCCVNQPVAESIGVPYVALSEVIT